jgi:hypothetical protein
VRAGASRTAPSEKSSAIRKPDRKPAAVPASSIEEQEEMIGTEFTVPRFWPNGSGLFTPPDVSGPGRELARIWNEGPKQRVVALTKHGYRDLGLADDFLSALAMLPKRETYVPEHTPAKLVPQVSKSIRPAKKIARPKKV